MGLPNNNNLNKNTWYQNQKFHINMNNNGDKNNNIDEFNLANSRRIALMRAIVE